MKAFGGYFDGVVEIEEQGGLEGVIGGDLVPA